MTEPDSTPPPNFRIRGTAAVRLVKIKADLEKWRRRPVTWTQVAEELIDAWDRDTRASRESRATP